MTWGRRCDRRPLALLARFAASSSREAEVPRPAAPPHSDGSPDLRGCSSFRPRERWSCGSCSPRPLSHRHPPEKRLPCGSRDRSRIFRPLQHIHTSCIQRGATPRRRCGGRGRWRAPALRRPATHRQLGHLADLCARAGAERRVLRRQRTRRGEDSAERCGVNRRRRPGEASRERWMSATASACASADAARGRARSWRTSASPPGRRKAPPPPPWPGPRGR
jgi:hypothetical protein